MGATTSDLKKKIILYKFVPIKWETFIRKILEKSYSLKRGNGCFEALSFLFQTREG